MFLNFFGQSNCTGFKFYDPFNRIKVSTEGYKKSKRSTLTKIIWRITALKWFLNDIIPMMFKIFVFLHDRLFFYHDHVRRTF